ncbi:hypothetical protein BO94DRAFT_347458 [Aspergillus sclerotioniger CBS 115572]|uniref:Uncharacterized protein n=1 Tax=Aspergillus sclerotioniger CBS 115572 TaxID=1450535 RepID=A0A317X4R8_9EURO|nr:hypothetical protein BO94DRAFT_347458 [Aspergillus sclerotioniger CBS 115572]PWY93614.1 hypothetical protein BO94DRAFT_347458 [Aspergillus sclerotioniger CBS 115572]
MEKTVENYKIPRLLPMMRYVLRLACAWTGIVLWNAVPVAGVGCSVISKYSFRKLLSIRGFFTLAKAVFYPKFATTMPGFTAYGSMCWLIYRLSYARAHTGSNG